MSKIVLFGAGRGAAIAHRHFAADSSHEVCAFTVESAYLTTSEYRGLPVTPFESLEQSYPPEEYMLFVLMDYAGMNEVRTEKYRAGKQKGYRFATYVSSSVHSLEPVNVGENSFIMDNQSINLDVVIGNNVVMWSSNHVGDGTMIGDNVWMSSHVCIGGGTTVGEGCFLANNCTLVEGIRIGRQCFIGANALISASTGDEEVYVCERTLASPMKSKRFMQLSALHCHTR